MNGDFGISPFNGQLGHALHAYCLCVVLIPKHKDAWRIKFAAEVLILSALPPMVNSGHRARSQKNPDIAPTAPTMFHRRTRPPETAAFGQSLLRIRRHHFSA